MEHLSFPYITLGMSALVAGVAFCWRSRATRQPAVIAAAVSLACFLLAAREVIAAGHGRLFDPLLHCFEADGLDAVPMAFYAALTLVFVILAPRRDADGRSLAGMLLITISTQTAYAAADLVTLAAGWWLSSLPFILGLFGIRQGQKLVQGFLIASCVALSAAIAILHTTEIDDLSHTSMLAFGLIILAVILRKGVFPLHSWMIHAFEHGPLLPTALLFNGHLGALLIARSEATALPQSARHALDILSLVAIATALITSVRAFAEKKPRRLLAILCVSQASFILAGLSTTNAEGITGALVHWLVVSAASTGLVCIVRVLEVRVSDVENPMMHLGLAVKAPRLATFFLVCGLALIGLPGTLGYCAEDLIFHGALESHPVVGIALLVATAFNAIHLIRLFNTLFLGVLPKHVIDIPDALPRERWPLTLCAVFLIFGGILPSTIIAWRSDAATSLMHALAPNHGASKDGH